MSMFWSVWIIVITLGVIFGCLWLLQATRKMPGGENPDELMNHSFDGIEEYNNPLPRWWLILFYITIVFGLLYLAYYPLGGWAGIGNWTAIKQYELEIAEHEARHEPIFAAMAAKPVAELIKDPEAMKTGQRLFATNCAICHGSSARGAIGFPNLSDADWLYGGTPEMIKTTLRQGRQGQMPAWGEILGDQGVEDATNHILSLSGREQDKASAERGTNIYQASCAACHGADAKGLQSVGAPNLTDDIWLYGGSADDIRFTLLNGRNGQMPAQLENLGEHKLHVMAAYVYSLSNSTADTE